MENRITGETRSRTILITEIILASAIAAVIAGIITIWDNEQLI